MIGLVQRVAEARVTVAGRVVGSIGRGLLLFVCAEPDDGDAIADRFAAKVLALRVFADATGKMNLDLAAVGGALLVVSQFTLMGDCRAGRRPSFVEAAEPPEAERLYLRFVERMRGLGLTAGTGVFRADMKVELVNDGPVTLLLDSRKAF